ncbi:hypothetical protein GALL_468490 [mine drainage metagenome]|uniref:Uncharacterized protein n=1 Tax=mine drainage metagenome TaxID=410659 RepID=A0A1J5PVF0_9ZZZZ
MSDLIDWIELHKVTVGLLQAVVLLLLAWVAGLFSYLRKLTAKPRLHVVETASFVFIEDLADHDGKPNSMRASFIINASLINASKEKVVLEQFLLSYRTHNIIRSYRQRLVRIAFPVRPRKRLGNGIKYMGVWFTEFGEDDYKLEAAHGNLDAKEMCAGYLLFASFTWRGWNPRIAGNTVSVRLRAKLTSGECIKFCTRLRVVTDPAFVEEFCPGLVEHVAHESTWNHDLSTLEV